MGFGEHVFTLASQENEVLTTLLQVVVKGLGLDVTGVKTSLPTPAICEQPKQAVEHFWGSSSKGCLYVAIFVIFRRFRFFACP